MFFTPHVIGKPGRMATSRGKFRLYVRNTLSFCEPRIDFGSAGGVRCNCLMTKSRGIGSLRAEYFYSEFAPLLSLKIASGVASMCGVSLIWAPWQRGLFVATLASGAEYVAEKGVQLVRSSCRSNTTICVMDPASLHA